MNNEKADREFPERLNVEFASDPLNRDAICFIRKSNGPSRYQNIEYLSLEEHNFIIEAQKCLIEGREKIVLDLTARDSGYISFSEHESLLESAVNAETARCLLICEEQKKEERAKVYLAAGNAISMAIDYQFGNETKIEALAKARDHLWSQAKQERENG